MVDKVFWQCLAVPSSAYIYKYNQYFSIYTIISICWLLLRPLVDSSVVILFCFLYTCQCVYMTTLVYSLYHLVDFWRNNWGAGLNIKPKAWPCTKNIPCTPTIAILFHIIPFTHIAHYYCRWLKYQRILSNIWHYFGKTQTPGCKYLCANEN